MALTCTGTAALGHYMEVNFAIGNNRVLHLQRLHNCAKFVIQPQRVQLVLQQGEDLDHPLIAHENNMNEIAMLGIQEKGHYRNTRRGGGLLPSAT